MKFKGATKPLLARYTKLLDERAAAHQAVVDAVAPRNDIRWQTCYMVWASEEVRQRYDAAQRAVFYFEQAMARDECRGYFEDGHFNWY
jgi:hypothetical protein